MPIRYEKRITRDMLRAEPEALWVFGDNLQRRGLGGQAKEMRGEPNAVGIPTKKAPNMHPCDMFRDADLAAYKHARSDDLDRLCDHLTEGGTIVLPADGLGTGRAQLERCAPAIWERLQYDLETLRAAADFFVLKTASTPSRAEGA